MKTGPLIAAAGVTLFGGVAWAADTWEQYDPGFSSFELYAGFEGLGAEREDRGPYLSPLLGIGLVDGLSAVLTVDMAAAEDLSEATVGLGAMLFGTPLDSDVVDLDLFLRIGWDGPAPSALTVAPSVELNIDGDPAMETWGLYLRGGVAISGAEGGGDPGVVADGLIGAWGVAAPGHMLLLEVFGTVEPGAERVADLGGVRLGYDVELGESVELINEVTLDIPLEGEPFAAGLMLGLIVALPSGDRDQASSVDGE